MEACIRYRGMLTYLKRESKPSYHLIVLRAVLSAHKGSFLETILPLYSQGGDESRRL